MAFPLVDDSTTSLLAWTTTPWTLPSNLALCVNPEYTYIKIHDQERNQNFIIHENLLRTLYKDPKKAKFKKLGQFKGSDMKGWRYIPMFEYFTEQVHYLFCSWFDTLMTWFSLKIALSVCYVIAMLPTPMAQELSTKLPLLATTITACVLLTM